MPQYYHSYHSDNTLELHPVRNNTAGTAYIAICRMKRRDRLRFMRQTSEQAAIHWKLETIVTSHCASVKYLYIFMSHVFSKILR